MIKRLGKWVYDTTIPVEGRWVPGAAAGFVRTGLQRLRVLKSPPPAKRFDAETRARVMRLMKIYAASYSLVILMGLAIFFSAPWYGAIYFLPGGVIAASGALVAGTALYQHARLKREGRQDE